MGKWQRWVRVTAWLGWLLGTWSAAQVSPQYVLPGGTVTWTLRGVGLREGGFYGIRVGTASGSAKALDDQRLTFVVRKDTIGGVLPLQVNIGGSTRSAELIVVGPDAEVGHDGEGRSSGDVTVNWVKCNQLNNAASLMNFLNEHKSSLSKNITDIKLTKMFEHELGGTSGACRCKVVEVSMKVELSTSDEAKRADALGAVLDKLHSLNGSKSDGAANPSIPQPLVVRSVMTHGLYHAGPDHVPLKTSGNGATIPFDVTKLVLPGGGPNKVLVAILDTGMATSVRGRFAESLVDNNSSKFNMTAPVDNFNVQDQSRAPLHQGTGHGTPAAWIVHQEAGAGVDILPIGVCDRNGLCRDSRIVQGLCAAAEFYRNHKNIYSGGLVINLSLGGFTPSDVLQTVLNDVTKGMSGVSVKPWVIAAAGNYDPTPQKGWNNFTKNFPYARVYPAGYGADSWAPSGQNPSFRMNDHVIAVGSLEHLTSPVDWRVANTSMRSAPKNYVRICAPGRNVESIDIAGNLAAYSGTSYAAPVVTGAVARTLTRTRAMDWRTIQSMLPAPIRTACL